MGSDGTYQVAVIGAGPAGLAAAYAARRTECVVLEAGDGLHDRHHERWESAARGVGGAGLYSDGKFSFWPSATELWNLDNRSLRSAWSFLHDVLPSDLMMQVGKFDIRPAPDGARNPATHLKRYPSFYVSTEDRRQIIATLASHVSELRTGSAAVGISRADEGWLICTEDGSRLRARQLIIATGRFSLIGMETDLDMPSLTQRRLEVGVRIEQASSDFFLAGQSDLDPKLILRSHDPSREWRTFCCCREGLVVPTTVAGLLSVSGRADCPPTGRSNAGFNLRVVDPGLAASTWTELVPRLVNLREPAAQGLDEFVAGSPDGPLSVLFGRPISEWLVEGLSLLRHAVGAGALDGATLIGPTLEGVVTYLSHDQHLGVPGARGLWVAGDAAGDFRGLTAALMSGYIAGRGAVALRAS